MNEGGESALDRGDLSVDLGVASIESVIFSASLRTTRDMPQTLRISTDQTTPSMAVGDG